MAKVQPLRTCAGCREKKAKNELIRVVAEPDGNITLDETGKKNGRGTYICKNPNCLALAIKNKGLERSLKMKGPENVYDSLKTYFDNQ